MEQVHLLGGLHCARAARRDGHSLRVDHGLRAAGHAPALALAPPQSGRAVGRGLPRAHVSLRLVHVGPTRVARRSVRPLRPAETDVVLRRRPLVQRGGQPVGRVGHAALPLVLLLGAAAGHASDRNLRAVLLQGDAQDAGSPRAALRDHLLLSAAQRAPFHRLRHSSAERMRGQHYSGGHRALRGSGGQEERVVSRQPALELPLARRRGHQRRAPEGREQVRRDSGQQPKSAAARQTRDFVRGRVGTAVREDHSTATAQRQRQVRRAQRMASACKDRPT